MSEKTNTQLLLENSAGKSAAKPRRGPKPKRPEPTVVWVDGQECVGIPLTKGMVAIVDKADAGALLPFAWCVESHGKPPNELHYAMRVEMVGKQRNHIKMHRLLMPSHLDVDHKNGNGLDNRRSNLRAATDSQNQGNRRKQLSSSRFKGVTWNKRLGKWIAQIGKAASRHHLGCFEKEVDAALVYNAAAQKKWADFAKPNTFENVK